MEFEIRPAHDNVDAVRPLFLEYAESLGIDLGFQSFEEELASLPGKYGPPSGRLLAAYCDGAPVGCVALRRFDETTCEMKRLFVQPAFRGRKIGLALVRSLLNGARAMGYESMILDSLASLENSVAMYRRAGFEEIPPYYHNPHPDAVYFRLSLSAGENIPPPAAHSSGRAAQ